MKLVHCWKGKREWIEETYGYLSDEYNASYDDPESCSTCMLDDGHEGPHEWTHDSWIVISFSKGSDPR